MLSHCLGWVGRTPAQGRLESHPGAFHKDCSLHRGLVAFHVDLWSLTLGCIIPTVMEFPDDNL